MTRGMRWVAILAVCQLAVGCTLFSPGISERFLGVDGRVFRGDSTESRASSIAVPGEASRHDSLLPIPGCTVSLEPWEPNRRPKEVSPERWPRSTTSNAEGQFELNAVSRPGRYKVTLSAECPGFKRTERAVQYEGPLRGVVIVLVPESP